MPPAPPPNPSIVPPDPIAPTYGAGQAPVSPFRCMEPILRTRCRGGWLRTCRLRIDTVRRKDPPPRLIQWNSPVKTIMPRITRVPCRRGELLARFIAAATLLGVAACSDPVIIDNRQLRPGILVNNGIPAAIDVPLFVDRGQTVNVTVVTFGTGCDEIGDTQVNGQNNEIEIVPRDWFVIPLPSQVCTADIRQFTHSAQLSFNQTGPATIRFLGRREPGGDDITLVAEITVR